MNTKICKSCDTEKPLEQFPRDGRNKCKFCVKQYQAEWRKNNLDKVRVYECRKMRHYRTNPDYRARDLQRHTRYRRNNAQRVRDEANKRTANRQALLNQLKAKPCKDCGQSFPPCCMDFDHVIGKKVANVSLMKTKSLERLMAEIAKCDLVCANCHRIRTFIRTQEQKPVSSAA